MPAKLFTPGALPPTDRELVERLFSSRFWDLGGRRQCAFLTKAMLDEAAAIIADGDARMLARALTELSSLRKGAR